jgi:MYXO-CTERM domain-containing protein
MPREEVEQLSSQLGVKFTEQGLPELKPLQSIGFVDRAPIPVTLNPNTTNTGLVVDGDGFTISLAASNSEGAIQDLTSDGRLIIGRQNLATFSGTGFSPNSEVKIWLFSTPVELGTVKTDSNGNFEGSLPLPSEIAVGEHTVQLNGLSKAGEERSVSVGVVVADAPALVSGDSSLGVFMWAFGLLALVTLWFILWRRRRSENEGSGVRKPLTGKAPIRRTPATDVVNSN